MSYILDALKKSEQERGHGNIPDVQTVHSSGLNYRNEKRAYWPYILITAVVLNLLAITYFIIDKKIPVVEQILAEQDKAIEADNDIDIAETKAASEVSATLEPARTTPATKPAKRADPEPAQKPPQEQAATETRTSANSNLMSSEATIIEFHDLPESIKLQLPAIIVSAHIYSSNPAQRSIVINNNFMEEGDYVIDGLILIEITSNGAIFNYDGTMFNYGVVSGWQ